MYNIDTVHNSGEYLGEWPREPSPLILPPFPLIQRLDLPLHNDMPSLQTVPKVNKNQTKLFKIKLLIKRRCMALLLTFIQVMSHNLHSSHVKAHCKAWTVWFNKSLSSIIPNISIFKNVVNDKILCTLLTVILYFQ